MSNVTAYHRQQIKDSSNNDWSINASKGISGTVPVRYNSSQRLYMDIKRLRLDAWLHT